MAVPTSASRPGSPGTGIGLSLVRELAELHGGRVEVESPPGQGACFVLAIPTDLPAPETQDEAVDAVEKQPEHPHDQPEPVIVDLSNEDVPCVLLVEDNAELRAFLRPRLGRSYRIEEAADGSQGLEKARAITPDAIITDGLMPVMDGLTMTRAIRADPEMDCSTLFRRLKRETGLSPEEYLREKRLQTAARLLAERAGNVAEVAEAVGFASVSSFSRRFRERFNTTPAAHARG